MGINFKAILSALSLMFVTILSQPAIASPTLVAELNISGGGGQYVANIEDVTSMSFALVLFDDIPVLYPSGLGYDFTQHNLLGNSEVTMFNDTGEYIFTSSNNNYFDKLVDSFFIGHSEFWLWRSILDNNNIAMTWGGNSNSSWWDLIPPGSKIDLIKLIVNRVELIGHEPYLGDNWAEHRYNMTWEFWNNALPVPAPASVWILLVGICTLVVVKRRKNQSSNLTT